MNQFERYNPQRCSAGEKEVLGRLQSGFHTVTAYQDFTLQEKALNCIPVDRLHSEAHGALKAEKAKNNLTVADDFYDALIKRLLSWFKKDFFRWVNQPECDHCNASTRGVGSVPPDASEILHGANRVELYECDSCKKHTRFPRYNSVGKLLETRRGRCGEWANCFTLCCIAMGFQARYVLDFTDHVWTEYYSQTRKRWVHLDSCEEAYDTPFVYEVGWGKKLTYVFSFTPYYCVDTINRYTRQLSEVMSRRKLCGELWLCKYLQLVMTSKLQALSNSGRDEVQKLYIEELGELLFGELRTVDSLEQIGRISGSS